MPDAKGNKGSVTGWLFALARKVWEGARKVSILVYEEHD